MTTTFRPVQLCRRPTPVGMAPRSPPAQSTRQCAVRGAAVGCAWQRAVGSALPGSAETVADSIHISSALPARRPPLGPTVRSPHPGQVPPRRRPPRRIAWRRTWQSTWPLSTGRQDKKAFGSHPNGHDGAMLGLTSSRKDSAVVLLALRASPAPERVPRQHCQTSAKSASRLASSRAYCCRHEPVYWASCCRRLYRPGARRFRTGQEE